MNSEQEKFELSEMLIRLMDGSISSEQFARLDGLLKADSDALEFYGRFMAIHARLDKPGDAFAASVESRLSYEPSTDELLWAALAYNENNAPVIEVDKVEEPDEAGHMPVVKVYNNKTRTHSSKLLITALVLSTAASLFLMFLVLLSPVRPVVGVLTDAINAEWISEDEIPVVGDDVRQGKLTLAKGFAEITFYNGAVVVVESPAVIELESAKSMFVSSGKVSAFVSKYAMGFTINTLSASVVDLGTEFGVSVESDGSCSLHMFKGKASLVAGRKDQVKTSQIVNVNEARSVDYRTGYVENVHLRDKSFARQINSHKRFVWRGETVCLADIVGGGDGNGSGIRGQGINTITGSTTIDPRIGKRQGRKKYTPVHWSEYVDGVFVPYGGSGNVVATSGIVCSEFPETMNTTYLAITNAMEYFSIGSVEASTSLGGIKYGSLDAPAIVTHSNAGITFDLDVIRSKYPGVDPVVFKTKCGITSSALTDGSVKDSKVDFWFLLDGKVCSSIKGITAADGEKEVDLPISHKDRFLSIAVTDAGDTDQTDWCIFAEPVLVLEQVQRQ